MDERTRAARFDRRAAPPEAMRGRISAMIARAGRARPGQRWLELGPGTGSVSVGVLVEPIDYVGLDRSAAMLSVFRTRLPAGPARTLLVQGDANHSWPVATGAVDVVLGARVLHRLDADRASAEILRVTDGRPATFLIGAVRRSGDSLRAVMRARMRDLLGQHGRVGQDRDEASKRVLGTLAGRGWHRLDPSVAARWSVVESPRDSIDDWERGAGLAGIDVPGPVKSAVLGGLRAWAMDHYGTLDNAVPSEAWYQLAGARVGDPAEPRPRPTGA